MTEISSAIIDAVGGDPTARAALARLSHVPLGQKLTALAASAQSPHLRAPWKLPANWAISTAYSQGDVVLANGYWWVCQGAGTSASSGVGPNTPTASNVVSDGTANWLLAGAPTATADDPQAPTITRSTTAPSAPDNMPWGLPVSPAASMVRLYGGYQAPATTDRYRVATFDRSASSTVRSSGGRIAFWSDAAKVTVLNPTTTGSEGPFRILIDGRYLTPSAFSNSAGTYTTIDWGAKKPRLYELEGWSREGAFVSTQVIYTTAADLIWRPSTDSDVRAYWISDSQSASNSFNPYQPGGGIPFRVARLLGWNDLWNASIGGTGYLNPNSTSGPFYTFRQRVTEGLTRNPDVWVFWGSTNDNGYTAAAITAEALATYQAVRAGGSKAPIFVIGVVPTDANATVTEAAIQAAVTQFNDPLTFFVPLANASPYPTTIGSYNRPASMSATVNTNARDINSTDGVHLLESADPKYAQFIADGIKQALPQVGQ